VIICICRGKSDRVIAKAIDNGATSVRDLQRCGIGDQCGSCHNSLRGMLASCEAVASCGLRVQAAVSPEPPAAQLAQA
jgi:bacterioferritin-associated ferredoxin